MDLYMCLLLCANDLLFGVIWIYMYFDVTASINYSISRIIQYPIFKNYVFVARAFYY
jgi:hypothetical protein